MGYVISERRAEELMEGVMNMRSLIDKLEAENEALKREIDRLVEQNKTLAEALANSKSPSVKVNIDDMR